MGRYRLWQEADVPDMSGGVDKALLEQELKMSCSNVMLQCLDADSRAIYILGTMFQLDSRAAAEIFEITPQAYRQRLSRIRKKWAAFLVNTAVFPEPVCVPASEGSTTPLRPTGLPLPILHTIPWRNAGMRISLPAQRLWMNWMNCLRSFPIFPHISRPEILWDGLRIS